MASKTNVLSAVLAGDPGKLSEALAGRGGPAAAQQRGNFDRPLLARAAGSLGARAPECLRILIQAGAIVDARDESGATALLWAARCGAVENVRELLSAGADPLVVDNDGMTALHAAALAKSAKIIEALLAAGCAVSSTIPGGESFLEMAGRMSQSKDAASKDFGELVLALSEKWAMAQCAEVLGSAPRLGAARL